MKCKAPGTRGGLKYHPFGFRLGSESSHTWMGGQASISRGSTAEPRAATRHCSSASQVGWLLTYGSAAVRPLPEGWRGAGGAAVFIYSPEENIRDRKMRILN